MAKRIQMQRKKGWTLPKNAISVDNPSKWGAPYEGPDAVAATRFLLVTGHVAKNAPEPTKDPHEWRAFVMANIGELRGKDLAVWADPDASSHADTLLGMANQDEDSTDSERTDGGSRGGRGVPKRKAVQK